MYDSLLELMEKTPFNKISVSNIVDKADVARLTFYRNFKSKEDILTYKGKEILDVINSRLDDESYLSKEKSFEIITNEFMKQSKFLVMICKNDLDHILIKSFRDDISDILNKIFPDISNAKLSFYVGGFTSVILDWFKGNNEDTLYNTVISLV